MTLRVRHAGLRTGQTGSCPVPAGTGGHGSIMEHAETVEGYEAVPLAWARAGAPASPLLAGARRRLRRGLDIACPVLVMCPATGWNLPGGPGGLLVPRALALRRAHMRLGEHVTWLKLAGGLPGQATPEAAGRRRVFDELGRWLSAYLSGQIRDQLL